MCPAQGNAIYNLLPDMISRLSDPECGVDEESFRTIMKYVKSGMRVNEICFDCDYIYAKGVPCLGKRNYSDITKCLFTCAPQSDCS